MIKTKIYAVLAALAAIAVAAFKFLLLRNEKQAEKIDNLQQEIETEKKVNEVKEKQAVFEHVQQDKAEQAQDTTELDKAIKERRELKSESDSNFTTITR